MKTNGFINFALKNYCRLTYYTNFSNLGLPSVGIPSEFPRFFTSGGSQNGKNAKNQHKMFLVLEFSILMLMDGPKNKKYINECPHF